MSLEKVKTDEAMTHFKGRSSLKRYMPIKCGIMVWARADASNGYMSAFQVVTGLGARVVKDLTENLNDTFTLIITSLTCLTCFVMVCTDVKHC